VASSSPQLDRSKESAFWQKCKAWLRASLASPWTQGFIFLILGAVLTWAIDRIHIGIQQRPFHGVWDPIIENEGRVPIVIGGIKQVSFHPQGTGPKKESKLPANVHLVGVQDATASALLQQRLARVYGKDTAIVEPEGFSDFKSTFVSVGGWSVNSVTYDILVLRKLDAKFQMFYPEHYAVDGADGKRYDAELVPPAPENGSIVKDYGFIIVGPNPYDKQKTVCLAFGIWPPGTKAALDALTDPDMTSGYGREFIEKLKTHRGVLAVVETEVHGPQQGRPVFVKVRDLLPQ
jgi:hypothetical protein